MLEQHLKQWHHYGLFDIIIYNYTTARVIERSTMNTMHNVYSAQGN